MTDPGHKPCLDWRRCGRFLDSAAPVICLVLLLGSVLLRDSISEDPRRIEREAKVRKAIEDIPAFLGDDDLWLMVAEVPVPTSQTEMLGLNAHVSRRYQRMGSYPLVQATIFIANSRDARSMSGHHPPNCYPASGWLLDREQSQTHVFGAEGGTSLPASIYSFGRGGHSGDHIWVINGFLIPGGEAVATLAETTGASGRAATSRLGLTQYQIVFRGDHLISDVIQHSSEILGSLPREFYLALSDGNPPPPVVTDGDGQ